MYLKLPQNIKNEPKSFLIYISRLKIQSEVRLKGRVSLTIKMPVNVVNVLFFIAFRFDRGQDLPSYQRFNIIE